MDVYRESSGIRSNRLKKAIERNRRKQLQRRGGLSDKWEPSGHSEGLRSMGPYQSALRREDRSVLNQNLSSKPVTSGPLKRSSLAYKLQRTEANPETMSSKSTAVKSAQLFHNSVKGQRPWYQKILVYGGWIFCFVLLGRLIFAQRGVVDYYSQEKLIQRKIYQNELIAKENGELSTEVKRLNEDPTYQRKLVRKHLGVIAKDEYLILFAREKYSPQTSTSSPP